jgi:two-component sensor histidine kinase
MAGRSIIIILLATAFSRCNAQLTQTRLANNIMIAGVIVLVLLSGLLYDRYRTRQRHNKQLETKQQEINEKNIMLERLITDKDNLIADKNVLLKEKEWLIIEIQHRVRNNLQIVISLLSAQSEFLNSPSALDAIGKSIERMQAIALIHQKLYQGNNNTRINMRSYISELVESIRNSFIEPGRISFQLNVDDIGLDISQSMPLGLILNEAITNAIKYAYPKSERGDIRISLQYSESEQLQLKIADNGKGLPAGFDTDRSNSLGLQLIKLFSEQLEGDLYFISNNGLEIILNFKPAGYNDAAIKKITT